MDNKECKKAFISGAEYSLRIVMKYLEDQYDLNYGEVLMNPKHIYDLISYLADRYSEDLKALS